MYTYRLLSSYSILGAVDFILSGLCTILEYFPDPGALLLGKKVTAGFGVTVRWFIGRDSDVCPMFQQQLENVHSSILRRACFRCGQLDQRVVRQQAMQARRHHLSFEVVSA